MNKKQVLDYGFVELVDYMGTDLTVVNSARVSFGKRKTEVSEGDKKLIKYLADNQHWSPFRHVQLQFHCKVPEAIARQWYKHVVGAEYSVGGATNRDHAWNEISGRYVDLSDVEYYVPQYFRRQASDNKQASLDEPALMTGALSEFMRRHLDESKRLYGVMVEMGVAREQARLILPLNIYTEYYWTISLQGLVNFIKLRNHSHAQYEIQLYAQALEKLIPDDLSISKEALLA